MNQVEERPAKVIKRKAGRTLRIVLIASAIAFLLLVTVIVLNNNFHWWFTPPWEE